MRVRVEFRLSMPGVNSWNGKWSDADKNYIVHRSLASEDVARLKIPSSWRHSFGDGWVACVNARMMSVGERARKSDGFCGYDWMVDRIIRWGDTQCRCEWRPDAQNSGWERCSLCGCGREVVPVGDSPAVG